MTPATNSERGVRRSTIPRSRSPRITVVFLTILVIAIWSPQAKGATGAETATRVKQAKAFVTTATSQVSDAIDDIDAGMCGDALVHLGAALAAVGNGLNKLDEIAMDLPDFGDLDELTAFVAKLNAIKNDLNTLKDLIQTAIGLCGSLRGVPCCATEDIEDIIVGLQEVQTELDALAASLTGSIPASSGMSLVVMALLVMFTGVVIVGRGVRAA